MDNPKIIARITTRDGQVHEIVRTGILDCECGDGHRIFYTTIDEDNEDDEGILDYQAATLEIYTTEGFLLWGSYAWDELSPLPQNSPN